jgi:hypothetical protein
MIRRIFSLAAITVFLFSCGNSGNKEVSAVKGESVKGTKVEFASLIENPGKYVGQNITVEGKVVHVCTESGKKMFIVGDNPDIRLFVAAGDKISKFPMELLGSKVEVEGLITRVGGAEAASDAMAKGSEAKGCAGMMGKASCETETALAEQPALANIIMEYNSHIVK